MLPKDPESGAGAVARGLRRGDRGSYQAVRRRVGKILAYRGYRMTAQDREEVEQEVMTQIWQSVSKSEFQPDDRFWGFVEVVTLRRSIDWRRRHREELDLAFCLADQRRNPLAELLVEERARLVSSALAGLGQSCRELIELRLEFGHGYREISRRLGRTEGALRVQMHRCVDKVRQMLLERSVTAGRPRSEEES